MRRQNLSLQDTFPIKLYQPEENPTVCQISEKDVRYFLCSAVSILKYEAETNSSLFRKDKNNTQVTTKSIAITQAINYLKNCLRHKSFST